MPIVGINLKKMNSEKKEHKEGKISIKNNIAIKDVVEKSFKMGGPKQKVLGFSFEFLSEFEPGMGKISIEGEVLYLDTEKITKDIVSSWKKDKKIPPETMQSVLNTALGKCNVKALNIAEDLSLPLPVPLPKVTIEKKGGSTMAGNYIG